MPIHLNQGPIDPHSRIYQNMLNNLQGNILKPHARDHAIHIFIKFTAPSDALRQWIRMFTAQYVTSAQQQLRQSNEKIFGNIFISATGYQALGYTKQELQDAFSADQEDYRQHLLILDFNHGMATHAPSLNDPDPKTWDLAYQDRNIDALIILADNREEVMLHEARVVINHIQSLAQVLTVEHGHVLRNTRGDSIEPFGYVDGLSQPLFLCEEGHAEQARSSTAVWNPYASLDLVLLPDPLAPLSAMREDAFGSYLVFRKLEQNLHGFTQNLLDLAQAVGCSTARAEALVMGRFKDGTPLMLSDAPNLPQMMSNDFDYRQDPGGTRCPFQAHIRRMNPRGETAVNRDKYDADYKLERQHRIVRRSMPYGMAAAMTSDSYPTEALPKSDVGLLFMCFQRSLSNQFGFLQTVWANAQTKSDGSQGFIGLDPIIGQPTTSPTLQGRSRWPVKWGQQQFKPFDFHQFVTLKGGEFLFAPSLPFLKSL